MKQQGVQVSDTAPRLLGPGAWGLGPAASAPMPILKVAVGQIFFILVNKNNKNNKNRELVSLFGF
jgi:hypothetical protein